MARVKKPSSGEGERVVDEAMKQRIELANKLPESWDIGTIGYELKQAGVVDVHLPTIAMWTKAEQIAAMQWARRRAIGLREPEPPFMRDGRATRPLIGSESARTAPQTQATNNPRETFEDAGGKVRVNNCALANGDDIKNCQICIGECLEKDCPDDILRSSLSEKNIEIKNALMRAVREERLDCKRAGASRDIAASTFAQSSTASPGESVTYTWGEEVYSPVKYHSFTVGPFSLTTAVREGETATQAMARAKAEIDAFATKVFEQKMTLFQARAFKRND